MSTTNTSYRLTGSLTVSSTTADAIDVNVNHVTIDLNGFAISGPGGSPTGTGINGQTAGALTVENGSITGFGAAGGSGVYTGNNGIVRNVQANANGIGIEAGTESAISGNTVNSNSADGIYCPGSGSGCLISGNTIDNNHGYGIGASDGTTGFGGNVLNGNGDGLTLGGTSMGNNICNGKLC
ncbi:MAG: right-handed parallel beta-helix repeat-containing protein [Candidatus Binatus sp.]